MKIRGWLLVAAMVLSAQCAVASEANASLDAMVDSVANNTNVDAAVKVVIKDLATAAAAGKMDAQVVLSGQNVTTAVEAGAMTASAIGGGGGVIAGRQAGLMAERKALGNVDSALASFKMNQNFANRLWASPFYTRQEMDQDDGYAGYNYKAWGASVGYDHVFGNFIAGAAFTYNRGDLDVEDVDDDNTIDNYGFSLYGQYYCNTTGFFATLTGGYNLGDNDMEARVNGVTHTSSYDADTYWLGGNVGKDFFIGENWTVTPSIGLFYSETETDEFRQYGNGVAGLDFSTMKSSALLMPIDLKVEYTTLIDNCSSLSFNVAGGYAYNWREESGRAEGSYHVVGDNSLVFVNGAKSGRSSWNIGAGMTYRRNNFDIGVNYRYDTKSNFDGHRVSATIGWNF